MRRRLGIGALFATLALFLAGCMKMDMNFTLTEDDTINGSMIMAVSDDFAEMSGQDPQEMWDSMGGELTGSLPAGVTQEPYAADGYTGVKLTYADQPLSALSNGAGVIGEDLSITREGDEFVIDGTMDMSDPSGDLDSAPPEVLDSFQMSMAFTFPGEVGETTGTVNGNTVTWTPKIGEVTEISARGSAIPNGAAAPGTSGDPSGEATDGATDGTTDGATGSAADEDSGSSAVLPLIIGIVILALALLGVVLWLAFRKKGTPAEVAAGQASGPYAFGQYPGQQHPGAPGQYPGQPGQYPVHAPGQYPAQPGQHQGQIGQHPQQYSTQPYPGQPGQPYPPQPGQPYPPQPGQQHPTQQLPPQPSPYGPPPAGQAPPGYAGYGQTPPPSPYAPPQPSPQPQTGHPQTDPTQPLDVGPHAGGYPPPAPPQGPPQGQPPGGYDDSEIDDATRLRDVQPPDQQTPPPPPPAP